MKTTTQPFHIDKVCTLPKHQIGMHRQDTWELTFIINGAGQRTVGHETQPFCSGEVVIIPPHIDHCWTFDEHALDTHGRVNNITVT